MHAITYQQIRERYEAGNAAGAIEAAKAAMLQDPQPDDAPRILELKGISHHALRQFEYGRLAFQAAAALEPLSASGMLAHGDCLFACGDPARAAEIYRALADDSRTPLPLLAGLARALGKVKQYERAVMVCQRAAALQPGCHHAQFGVAFYMAKADSPPAAIVPLIQKSIDMAPGVFGYRIALITTLQKLNQNEKAYLAIADATTKELASVRCRCCINRLIQMFENAGDMQRAKFCRSRVDGSCGNCS